MTSKFNGIYNKKLSRFDEFVKKEYYRDSTGKMVVKNKATRPGYRVKMIKGKPTEIRMDSKERLNRARAAKRSAIKRYKKSSIRKTTNKLTKIGS